MDAPEESKKNHSSLFQNSLDVSLFYEQCSRRRLLNEVKQAVFDSVSHLTIFGEEGSGKTMLCKMVEREMASHFLVVFYGRAVESFEDVIRVVALKTGIRIEGEIGREHVNDLLDQILSQLQENNKRLLIIFDEAEKVFLATLERIRKMLDVLNENGLYLQVLFSGEDSLQENLQQLSLCTFHGATERSFSLQPLDEEETYGYLNFRLRSSEKNPPLFSRETAGQIFKVAGGNFAQTNNEAEKMMLDLASAPAIVLTSEKSHPVRKRVRKKIKWKRISAPGWLKRYQFLPGLGAIVGIVVLVVIILNWQHQPEPVTQKEQGQSVITKAEVGQSKDLQVIDPVKEKHQQNNPKSVKNRSKPSLEKERGNRKIAKVKTKEKRSAVTETKAIENGESQNKEKQPIQKTVTTGRIETQPFIVISSESSRFIPKRTDFNQISLASSQTNSVDQLFDKRVEAAGKWKKRVNWKLYTLQLMLLSAESAEENVKKVLRRPEYQEVSDRLFILRAAAPSPSIYVFYGEFSSMVSAKLARNRLPSFLGKHNPYITTVKDAVLKAGFQ